MASAAKDRVSAIGKQLAPAVVETATFEGIPPIKQLAPASNGARAQGKVVIITGILEHTQLELFTSKGSHANMIIKAPTRP